MREKTMEIPQGVFETVKKLQEAGYEAYLVGGAVRDVLLGLTPQDWDVATSALPQDVMRLFPKTVPTGLKFGTVTVIAEMPIEVTAFRREGRYLDGRKPSEVRLGVTLLEDLSRRDFTVNAIAFDPVTGQYVDPFRGMEDLANGRVKIKTVGEPHRVFRDDALRLLRAFSLFAKLHYHVAEIDIAEDTISAIRQEAESIRRISAERIQMELNKIITSAIPHICLERMATVGLLQQILPELYNSRGIGQQGLGEDAFNYSLSVMSYTSPKLELRLAALLHRAAHFRCSPTSDFQGVCCAAESAALARDILARLKYSNHTIATVTHLIANQLSAFPARMPEVRRLVRKVGQEHISALLELEKAKLLAAGGRGLEDWELLVKRVEQVMASGDALTVQELQIRGSDIIKTLGIGPGPEVGRILNRLLDMVLDRPQLNERDALLSIAQKLKDGEGDRRM